MLATDDTSSLVLVLVGLGPRGAGLLERLVANLGAARDDGPVEVHLVDPYPVGGGRVWRSAQSELLRLNTTAEDLTAFVDESVTMAGPVTPGPTMAEWAGTYGVDLDDPALVAESLALGPLDFPSRRLASAYFDFAVRRTLERVPEEMTLVTHAQRAVDLRESSAGHGVRQVVVLEDGELITADAVVLLNSHVDVRPAPHLAALAAFAAERGLTYLPPGYAGDLDLSVVPAGEDVLVRGFGLDFIDLMVLLTEGRGGRYVSVGDRLVYEPSGAEPHLLVGSRRGVPYHAKPMYRLRAGKPSTTTFCTVEAVGAVLRRGDAIDFRTDLWPLVGREVAWWFYRELGLGHPERITTSWDAFADTFAALPWGSEAYARWIVETVPDPADHFDPAVLDRPLRDLRVADADELAQVVRGCITADLARRKDDEHSADLGAFFALLAILPVVGPALGSPRMDPHSLARDFYGRFMGFFSFWASGPPHDRLEQLLALEEAGVVAFLGPDLEVVGDAARGAFVARSSAVPGEVEAPAFVEATLPAFDLARTEDPLLAALAARGEASSQVLVDASGRLLDTGQLRTDPSHHLVRADGSVAHRRLALGMHTALKAAAFARPCTDGPVHRLNDQVARALLALPRPGSVEDLGDEQDEQDEQDVLAGTSGTRGWRGVSHQGSRAADPARSDEQQPGANPCVLLGNAGL